MLRNVLARCEFLVPRPAQKTRKSAWSRPEEGTESPLPWEHAPRRPDEDGY
uniref:Uncharacterized protein n=1 Tax=Anguilla anguilla TaxID=7936 RepID=A0A0E9VW47_ANGAN